MPASRTMISATTSKAAAPATMDPIISSARCSDAPSGVVGGPTTLTPLSRACIGSPNLASVLLENAPTLVAELALPVLVEGRLREHFAECGGIRRVEGQPLRLQAL